MEVWWTFVVYFEILFKKFEIVKDGFAFVGGVKYRRYAIVDTVIIDALDGRQYKLGFLAPHDWHHHYENALSNQMYLTEH